VTILTTAPYLYCSKGKQKEGGVGKTARIGYRIALHLEKQAVYISSSFSKSG